MKKCLTSRQAANHARMSLEKYVRSSDFQHLRDAHKILSDAIQAELEKDEQISNKASNYS